MQRQRRRAIDGPNQGRSERAVEPKHRNRRQTSADAAHNRDRVIVIMSMASSEPLAAQALLF